MTDTLWHMPTLRQRTEAASRLPKGDLPEVGTVVHVMGRPEVVRRVLSRDIFYHISAQGTDNSTSRTGHWRYATPAEIDQFERDSAPPPIVDPIEAEAKEMAVRWVPSQVSTVQMFAARCINRGIEIERARKAGA